MSPNVAALTAARFDKCGISGLFDPPNDFATAYADQIGVAQAWLGRLGGSLSGYKVACTNEVAQRLLGVDAPFYGRLFSATIWDSPVVLDASDFFMRVIEPEFGFQMATDLEPRAAPFTTEEVAAAVGALLPVVEIVDSRYEEWTKVGARALIVDNACHGGWVRGRPNADWQTINLAVHPVRFFLNGTEVAFGTGAAVLGHPVNALTWLANMLRENGIGLTANDYVSTGVCTDICFANAGDHVVVDYGILGVVDLRFS
jgi:2-keto-4-pentenoate hydratase